MSEIHFTAKDILQKNFKQKMRGYDPTDVDSFLDMVIRDYETFNKSIDQLRNENNDLRSKIDDLSERLSSLNTSASLESPEDKTQEDDYDHQPSKMDSATYMDILKRLSNLENHVFGNHVDDQKSHRL